MHVSYGVPLPLSVKAAVYEVVGCFKKRSHKLFDCLIIVLRFREEYGPPNPKFGGCVRPMGPPVR